MNSKTSSCKLVSGAIFKADLANHWVWMTFASIILALNVLNLPGSHSVYERNFGDFVACMYFSLFFAAAFGFFMGTKLFMYLDKQNSVACMHGLPFSRRTLYLSHTLSGFCALLIPGIFAFLLLMISSNGNSMITLPRAAAFLAMYLIYGLIAFAVSVFSMTVCGNVVVSMLFSCTIAVMPAALIAFVAGICATKIYGFVFYGNTLESVLKFLYVFPHELFPVRFVIYLGGALVFLAAGYFIYKIRPLENCEEVVAFRKLRGLFVYAVGTVCGMVSYLLFALNSSSPSLLCMLPLGIAGVVIAAMIAKKSLSLSGTLHYVLIFSAVIVAITGCIRYDVFGYERRVPDVEDVEFVVVGKNYNYNSYSGYTQTSFPDEKIEKREDIEKITSLHKAYIADKKADRDALKFFFEDSFAVKYTLKNGSTIERSYSFLSDENYEKYMLPVLDINEMKEKHFPIFDSTDKELISVVVEDDRVRDFTKKFPGDSREAQRLYNAIIADIGENSYTDLQSNGSITLTFSYFVPGNFATEMDADATAESKRNFSRGSKVRLNENFSKTFAVLEELGCLEQNDALPENVAGILIEQDGFTIIGTCITDREVMQRIHSFQKSGNRSFLTADEMQKATRIKFLYVDENKNIISSTSSFPMLPEEIPDYLKEHIIE